MTTKSTGIQVPPYPPIQAPPTMPLFIMWDATRSSPARPYGSEHAKPTR